MNPTKVLLVFGGESSEHDVSISSARNVQAAIDSKAFKILFCYIDNSGKWYLLENFEQYNDLATTKRLMPSLGGGCFTMSGGEQSVDVDVIFPILHGRNGEDGSVQGLAQLLHIPIVGCDVTASAIGMDKLASKEIAAAHGITIVPYIHHRSGEQPPEFESVITKLGLPLFVKPSRAGSSVGVSKVQNEQEFVEAIKEAHHHDTVVLIEKAIHARELEVAILGTPPSHQASVVGEIMPGEEFYSYDDKYATSSKATTAIPADISDDVAQKVRGMAQTVYESIGCSGLSRVDFFLDENGDIYFNEINTLPGFTDISMYPKLWQHDGVSYPHLINKLINDAMQNGTINS